MNVVDSSAWLEYLADGPNADFFAAPIEASAELLIPTVSLYEVFKRVLQHKTQTLRMSSVSNTSQKNEKSLPRQG